MSKGFLKRYKMSASHMLEDNSVPVRRTVWSSTASNNHSSRGGKDKRRDEKVGRQCDQQHGGMNRDRGSTQRKEQMSFLTGKGELWAWEFKCRKYISGRWQVPSEDKTVARVHSLRGDRVGAGSGMKVCRT